MTSGATRNHVLAIVECNHITRAGNGETFADLRYPELGCHLQAVWNMSSFRSYFHGNPLVSSRHPFLKGFTSRRRLRFVSFVWMHSVFKGKFLAWRKYFSRSGTENGQGNLMLCCFCVMNSIPLRQSATRKQTWSQCACYPIVVPLVKRHASAGC